MEIIDLYNKIYEEEEMPQIIRYRGTNYKWDETHKDYATDSGLLFLRNRTPFDLEDKVEIIEEDNKIKHSSRFYDLSEFREDYPEPALLLKEITDKIYILIDEVNKLKEK